MTITDGLIEVIKLRVVDALGSHSRRTVILRTRAGRLVGGNHFATRVSSGRKRLSDS